MSMKTPLIIANWKMNKTAAEAIDFVQQLKSAHLVNDREIIVCGPYTTLPALQSELSGHAIGYGAQNMHWETAGAYTGEISVDMLQEYGCTHVILGHSERREYFAETDETVRKKVATALAAGLTPIICVGENLDLRQAGTFVEHVEQQVQQALQGVNTEEYAKLVFAYEPIWAIGTGETATPEQAQEVHAVIRAIVGEETRIIYGGSVKPDNIAELMQQPDIDGVLVGGASVQVSDFLAIAQY